MPPRPIDSRNVYQKTLHAQYEAEKLHEGLEKDKHIRQRLSDKERSERTRDMVDIPDDRPPTRKTEKEAHREKRREPKRDPEERESEDSTATDDEEWDELRKRLPSDDAGKGGKLDVKG